MYKYILKRIAMMLIVLIGVTFVVYFIVDKTPGDPEQVLRQMVLLGGAPAGTTLLSWDYNTGGVESSDGSTATITP